MDAKPDAKHPGKPKNKSRGKRERFPLDFSWLSWAGSLLMRSSHRGSRKQLVSTAYASSAEWVQGAVSRRRLWRMQAGEGPMRHRAQAPALAPAPARQCRIVEDAPWRGAVSRRRLWRVQAGEGPMRHRAQGPALASAPARQCRIVGGRGGLERASFKSWLMKSRFVRFFLGNRKPALSEGRAGFCSRLMLIVRRRPWVF